LIHVYSVGGGGGSIAKVTREGRIQVGPESAGAVPGPACFNLGGTRPTVTDATLVLGWIDPGYFLGGKKKLDAAKAYEAIERGISSRLNISVREAASGIIDELTSGGANALRQLAAERGHEPEKFVLFSFGGGGGLFCAEVARKCGIKRIYTFPFSSVFSAFGLSAADINHTYEWRCGMISKIGEALTESEVRELVTSPIHLMKNWAYRDMRGEGFGQEEILFAVEAEVTTPDGSGRDIYSVPHADDGQVDAKQLNDFLQNLHRMLDAPELIVEFIRLRARVPIPHYRLPAEPLTGKDPSQAQKGVRTIFWHSDAHEAKVYEWQLLRPGNEIAGPALIESKDTTIYVPPGAAYQMDQHGNGILEVQ
jgi:N-methylhydantoinase A/oxoprolinase/acetone carboxylase beta subunit